MAGRKPRYDSDRLNFFIDHYFQNNTVFGQVTATDIAKYIRTVFHDNNIQYYHFTRNPEINERINDINHTYALKDDKNTMEVMIPFNSDKFLELFKNNPKVLKVQLRFFAQRYDDLNSKVIDYQSKCIMLENELNSLKEYNLDLDKRNKELNQVNQRLRQYNAKLKNFKKFNEIGEMLNYLKVKGLITTLNEETLGTLLNNCNFGSYDITNDTDILSNNDSSFNETQYDSTIDNNNIINFNTVSQVQNNRNSSDSVNNAMNRMRSRLKNK